jgi:hypothetical protein
MINGYGDMTDWHSKRAAAVEVLSGRRARCRLRIGALLAQGSDGADAHRNSAKWLDHGHSNRGRAIAKARSGDSICGAFILGSWG